MYLLCLDKQRLDPNGSSSGRYSAQDFLFLHLEWPYLSAASIT